MPGRESLTPREREVWARLGRVTDPELDESITDMGFVEAVSVAGAEVTVAFRLPTYWCSPNFAFLMAEGIRSEAGALPWVAQVRVRLEDHLCADEINAAASDGRSFTDAFALREDGGDLAEVRATFEVKAFQRRQEAVLAALVAAGRSPEALAAMTVCELDGLGLADPEAARQQGRYREILARRGLAETQASPAFPDADGQPLTADGFAARMRRLRGVRINMEFGGALCRGLAENRYKQHAVIDGEPTLVDFIQGRVPPRTAAG